LLVYIISSCYNNANKNKLLKYTKMQNKVVIQVQVIQVDC